MPPLFLSIFVHPGFACVSNEQSHPLAFLRVQVLVGSVTGDDAFISGRRIISLNQLDLTDIKVDLSIGASQGDINSAAASAAADFAATGWAKKKAKKALRASLSDFQRFKVMTLRKKRSRALKAALGK